MKADRGSLIRQFCSITLSGSCSRGLRTSVKPQVAEGERKDTFDGKIFHLLWRQVGYR